MAVWVSRYFLPTMKAALIILVAGLDVQSTHAIRFTPAGPWDTQRVQSWYSQRGWFVGVNFIPSSAVNQLEMWQAATFDEHTIDRELGYAANIGISVVRVFLHDMAYIADPPGFLGRVDRF